MWDKRWISGLLLETPLKYSWTEWRHSGSKGGLLVMYIQRGWFEWCENRCLGPFTNPMGWLLQQVAYLRIIFLLWSIMDYWGRQGRRYSLATERDRLTTELNASQPWLGPGSGQGGGLHYLLTQLQNGRHLSVTCIIRSKIVMTTRKKTVNWKLAELKVVIEQLVKEAVLSLEICWHKKEKKVVESLDELHPGFGKRG